MNNRGKPLSKLELLKNRLIYLTTLLDQKTNDTSRLRKDINEAWKTVYEYLGKNKSNILDDDMFLNHHWIMYFKYDREEADTYAKFLLNKHFTHKKILSEEIGFKDIKDYVESISKCIRQWFYIHNPSYSHYSKEIKEWLSKLSRVGYGAFTPLLMSVMVREVEESKLLHLIKAAENFVFLVFTISRRPQITQNSHFYKLANMYHKRIEGCDIDYVIEDIDALIYSDTEEYSWLDLENFETFIDKQFKEKEGFYSWNGIKYLLYEYELELQNKAKGESKVIWEEFNKRKKEETIETYIPTRF
jgi:hypothetical protein